MTGGSEKEWRLRDDSPSDAALQELYDWATAPDDAWAGPAGDEYLAWLEAECAGSWADPEPRVAPEVAGLAARLRADGPPTGASVDLLTHLADVEALRRTLDWYTGEVSVAADAARRAEDVVADVAPRLVGASAASEIGLARRVSPAKAARDLGLAKVARAELPHTWARLRDGHLPAQVVRAVASATVVLDRDDRLAVDESLAADPATLHGLSERAVGALARRHAYEADPRAFVAARGRAEQHRYVSWRPQPDLMMQVTALLPLAQGVAVAAALTRAAEQARAAGDERARAQVMADTLVERATGQAAAGAIPLAVTLLVAAETLTSPDGGGRAATVVAPGLAPEPVPGPVALDLVGRALESGHDPTLRRLVTEPGTLRPIALEARSRLFPEPLKELIRLRDGVCRTPWCGAPVRHADHVVPWAEGGPTSADNGIGRCERCNHVKQHPGWRERLDESGRLHIQAPSGLSVAEPER